MKSLDRTQTRASNRWHIVRLQGVWWCIAAVAGVAIATCKRNGLGSIAENLRFTIGWTTIAFAVSSTLVFIASRLNMLSLRPAKQAFLGFIGFVVGTAALCLLFLVFSFPDPEYSESTGINDFVFFALNLALWTAVAIATGQVHRIQFQKRTALKAYAEKSEIELRFIRQQVKSYFVFNALDSIMVAIKENPQKAGSMILNLSHLLRQSLDTLQYMGTLGDELKRIQIYTGMGNSRPKDNLKISLNVADDLLSLPCLPMVLQPLVDNAIKLSSSQAAQHRHIEVRAQHSDSRLTISVVNRGHLAGVDAARQGGGFNTVRRRLEMKYGDEAQLELMETVNNDVPSVTARISWPSGYRHSMYIDEYMVFGPWVYEIDESHPIPPEFENHIDSSSRPIMTIKIPIKENRNELQPRMILYDHMVIAYDDHIDIIRYIDGEIVTEHIPYNSIEAIENSSALLNGTFCIFTGDRAHKVEYNTVSSEVILNLTKLIRERLPVKARDISIPSGRGEGRFTFFFNNLWKEIQEQEDRICVAAYQPETTIEYFKRSIFNKVFKKQTKQRLLDSLYLYNNRELIIVSRSNSIEQENRASYDYTFLFIPFDRIRSIEKEFLHKHDNCAKLAIKMKRHIRSFFIDKDNPSFAFIEQFRV